jgi:sugar lactone lactonase YvrE
MRCARARRRRRRAARGHPEPRQALRFPLGLAVSTERLYIADSGHHRILECSHGGRILRQFGLGTADFMDGNLAEAAFHRPQALVLERDSLYVADTGNHAVRRINLLTGIVDTLCGNGRPGAPVEGPVAQARQVSLDHPSAWPSPTTSCTSRWPATTASGATTWVSAACNGARRRCHRRA